LDVAASNEQEQNAAPIVFLGSCQIVFRCQCRLSFRKYPPPGIFHGHENFVVAQYNLDKSGLLFSLPLLSNSENVYFLVGIWPAQYMNPARSMLY